MLEAGQPSGQQLREFWIARGAILVTAALSAFLINNLTIFPWWLASAVEVALLVPLSVATAWASTPAPAHRMTKITRVRATGLWRARILRDRVRRSME